MPEIKTYLTELNRQYATGIAREHSYRPALQRLLAELLPKKLTITNEPAHINCGAPDYIITKDNVPLAFIEAKDIGDADLDGNRQNKEQFTRYKKSLDKIIFTDYLDFHLYENGEFTESARIAEIRGNKITVIPENRRKFQELINRIAEGKPQKITSSAKLAQIMANKARLLAEVIQKSLEEDKEETSALTAQMKAFQEVLIHDLNAKTFADIYAQTIAYGMFAARLHDKTPEDFSRFEAANLIPKTNPFLRKIFQNIAGYEIDARIAWIVDDLVNTFCSTDMEKIMTGFGKRTRQDDPMIHFYEDFLNHYDPQTRRKRGVYYTPQPIVTFIVRAIDEILQKEFDLQKGLADTSKIKIKTKSEEKELHKVQILDPATGTGTFLAEVIRKISDSLTGQKAMWQSYVENHLLPRVYGFEFMMAPYTIAHLKLDMVLESTGFKAQNEQRLNVYLTNSLEAPDETQHNFYFAQELAKEAQAANEIKREAPVMIVLGNPPYSVSSSNKGGWINEIMNEYKKDLNEKNIQPLSDDYIKFIRLGHDYVQRNGEGILAYISNNSFIDGIIHRQMRKSLMQTFDDIYIIDLHGNTRKKETAPDGGKDENVFDIMQGVSINIFVKNAGKSVGTAQIHHTEIYGTREEKYAYLTENSFYDIKFQKLKPTKPQYFFVPKDYSIQNEYNSYIPITEFFIDGSMGIATGNDEKLVSFTKNEPYENTFLTDDFLYRPFDIRFTVFDNSILQRARYKIMSNYFASKNIGLNVVRQSKEKGTETLFSSCISNRDLITNHTYNFPLYIYLEKIGTDDTERIPNLNREIWKEINAKIGREAEPLEIFDYIYGVLHTSKYRERYKEFLKVDFPRIPYPKNDEEFTQIVKIGAQLRTLHLMEKLPKTDFAQFNKTGSNTITDIKNNSYRDGKVFINEAQSFENVPETAWNFYIGGYQPAQKWLKDRKNRSLEYDDVIHYQNIIKVLMETDRLMKELDEISEIGKQ